MVDGKAGLMVEKWVALSVAWKVDSLVAVRAELKELEKAAMSAGHLAESKVAGLADKMAEKKDNQTAERMVAGLDLKKVFGMG